jgi:hypothetical protein
LASTRFDVGCRSSNGQYDLHWVFEPGKQFCWHNGVTVCPAKAAIFFEVVEPIDQRRVSRLDYTEALLPNDDSPQSYSKAARIARQRRGGVAARRDALVASGTEAATGPSVRGCCRIHCPSRAKPLAHSR